MALGGYAGTILNVKLNENGPGDSPQTEREPLDEGLARKLIGGRGYGAYLLYKNAPKGVDPMSPENPLIVGTGPLTGTPLTGSKFVCITKSPLTGIINDSYSGGEMAGEIKFAGYDHIVIKGRCAKPSILYIEDDKVELLDASHLWGLSALDAESKIKEEMGNDVRAVVIGPGGENLVPYACVCSDYYHQSGRGGIGAVMGSKKIKALVVKGSKSIPIAHPKKLANFRQYLAEREKKSAYGELRVLYGTTYTTVSVSSIGILPTRNFQQGTFEGIEKINAFQIRERLWQSNHGCLGCQAPCMNYVVADEGKVKVVGPEYETIALLGSNVGVDNLDKIALFNELCDAYGIDTISAGNAIAFGMECYERGLITKEDTDGIDLRFGNVDAVVEMIRKIALREGFGDMLAQGVKKAAEKIGQGSEKFAMHVKGMEISGYEPRGAFAMGLAYATATRGGCHRRAKPIEIPNDKYEYEKYGSEGNAPMVKELQDFREPVHCGILCDAILRFSFEATLEDVAEMYRIVVGWEDITADELKTLADRVYTLTRCYNMREGQLGKDDTLPWRMIHEPLPDGPGKGNFIGEENMTKMVQEYYHLRGWDTDGRPTAETIERLGLTGIVESC
jgi:aldehyde:ferredoxin oxidoreductase